MKFQIGKAGLTQAVIDELKLRFKNNKVIRISVLKNASPSKEKTKEIADELVKQIGKGCRYSLIGFTIILRRPKILGA